MKIKSKEKLLDFVAFCIENPSLRFWQALREWSKFNFIFASNVKNIRDIMDLDKLADVLEDTYYIE